MYMSHEICHKLCTRVTNYVYESRITYTSSSQYSAHTYYVCASRSLPRICMPVANCHSIQHTRPISMSTNYFSNHVHETRTMKMSHELRALIVTVFGTHDSYLVWISGCAAARGLPLRVARGRCRATLAATQKSWFLFKGRPEPLEKEIHEILGSKREDRFPNPFFGTGTKYMSGSFLVPASLQ